MSFALDARAFSYWDAERNRWRVAPGCYSVQVAPSGRAPASRGHGGGRRAPAAAALRCGCSR